MRQTATYSARFLRQPALAILQRVTCCALIAFAAFAAEAQASSPRTVTLVTGDQVVVDSDN
jgi:hypothetical protein